LKTTILDAKYKGIIVRAVGLVINVEFQTGNLPNIHDGLKVIQDHKPPLFFEVQEYINPNTVRTIAMNATAGPRRGLVSKNTEDATRII
jgi:F-type H+-transporting ATPase subunit beta